MITWNLVDVSIDGDKVTASIQEVVDTVAGKIYTASTNRKRVNPKQEILDKLKVLIKADRVNTATEAAMESSIDLMNFEDVVNT